MSRTRPAFPRVNRALLAGLGLLTFALLPVLGLGVAAVAVGDYVAAAVMVGLYAAAVYFMAPGFR